MLFSAFFLSEIFHFVVNVLSAFIFFAGSFLYFDSWQLYRSRKTPLIRALGFLLLALMFSVAATNLTDVWGLLLQRGLALVGLGMILSSLWFEPILHKPGDKALLAVPLSLPAVSFAVIPYIASLSFLIGITYLRKSKEGLEKQLQPASLAFFLLGIGELLKLQGIWSHSSSIRLSQLFAEYGPVWFTQLFFQLAGIVVLGIWIWGYVRFRLPIQLFLSTALSVLSIFLIATCFFMLQLMGNIVSSETAHLHTDVKTLQYALERLQAEALANARAIGQDSTVISSIQTGNKESLHQKTFELLLSQNGNFLLIASASGEVLARAEDKENVGDILRDDVLVTSALNGQKISTIVSNPGLNQPTISITAAVPIYETTPDSRVLGVVKTGFTIDNAFVDGVKEVTGLDVSLFSGDKRVASTFVAPDGKSRYVGTTESNPEVIKQVLGESKTYVGSSAIFNQPYLTAYYPLRTYGDKTIGMLFVGKPQSELMTTVQRALSLTFRSSVVLMALSIVPSFFFARFLEKQLKA